MMKTNFSQKRVEKNGESAEKSLFLRWKPLLLVGQKGSTPPSKPKRSKTRSFLAKSAKTGAKSPNMWTGLPRPHRETEKKTPPETEEKGDFKIFYSIFFAFYERHNLLKL